MDSPEMAALQDQLQRTQLAYQMASEMAQFKAGFLARTSHELRSPLNSVISLHQLILSDLCESPEEEREFIAQALGAAEKMLALLDRLIAIAKTEYGTPQLDLEPVPLQPLLMEVEALTQLQARNRNFRLEIALPESNWRVLADSRWLKQVLVHLIDLSILNMQEGTIRVTAAIDRTAQEVQIQVEDQRPAAAWQEAIDLLQRLSDPQVDAPDASDGLNLLVCQTLIERMNGRLELVEGQANGLYRVRCSLPLGSNA